MTTPIRAKVNYLTNKDMMEELQKSKNSFSSYISEDFELYDYITTDLSTVTIEVLEEARNTKIQNYITKIKRQKSQEGIKNYEVIVNEDDFPLDKIVVRLMTPEHIPLIDNPEKLKKAKTEYDRHIKVNFPPFQHFIYKDNTWQCVGKSHWRGGIENGEFCATHGRITNKLASMYMMLIEKYSQKGNWRNYSYIDEMRCQALTHLTQNGLKFDESKGSNPFAYCTTIMTTSFCGVLNSEKKSQAIRDDLLIMHGATPSHTRQVEDSILQQQAFMLDEAIKRQIKDKEKISKKGFDK